VPGIGEIIEYNSTAESAILTAGDGGLAPEIRHSQRPSSEGDGADRDGPGNRVLVGASPRTRDCRPIASCPAVEAGSRVVMAAAPRAAVPALGEKGEISNAMAGKRPFANDCAHLAASG
jgi:hypothetical protein